MKQKPIPILKADIEAGEGFIHLTQEWRDLPPLLRADILKDWLGDMKVMYENSVRDAFMRGEVRLEESNERV
jgi:hypothetical protein